MRFEPCKIYLIENHSIDHALLFRTPEDYNCFLHKIRKELGELADIYSWNLLPESFELILFTKEIACVESYHLGDKNIQLLTRKIGTLLSSYAQYFNKKYNRSGSLFCQKTKSRCLDPQNPELVGITTAKNVRDLFYQYFMEVHNRPVEKGLVKNAQEWMYSSLKDYLGQRHGTLCNTEQALQTLQLSTKQIKKLFPSEKYYQLETDNDSITLV
ncbi:MAG: hypothetical protein ACK4E0_15665 [Chitinophagaceae bacterium]